ncbi:hypothetical protein FQZ97_994670 [compost metagenome]
MNAQPNPIDAMGEGSEPVRMFFQVSLISFLLILLQVHSQKRVGVTLSHCYRV